MYTHAYETQEEFNSYGFTQISRLYWWEWCNMFSLNLAKIWPWYTGFDCYPAHRENLTCDSVIMALCRLGKGLVPIYINCFYFRFQRTSFCSLGDCSCPVILTLWILDWIVDADSLSWDKRCVLSRKWLHQDMHATSYHSLKLLHCLTISGSIIFVPHVIRPRTKESGDVKQYYEAHVKASPSSKTAFPKYARKDSASENVGHRGNLYRNEAVILRIRRLCPH